LNPPARVEIVRLPDLPDGGDVADWRAANEGADCAAELLRICGRAPNAAACS